MIMRMMCAGLALLAMSACGYRGGLERPGPMWGEERAQWEAEQKAKKEAEEKAKAQPAPAPTP
jgi:predicted small lipoprotein YifL